MGSFPEGMVDADALFRAAFDHAPLGMALLSAEGTVIETNRALAERVGEVADRLVGHPLTALGADATRVALAELAAGAAVAVAEVEDRRMSLTPVRDRQGRLRQVILHLHPDPAPGSRAGHADAVTGLPGRGWLEERLAAGPPPAGVVLLDLDRFRGLNERFGHAHGDAVLRAAARRLGERRLPGEAVVRFAGDQFLVLVPTGDAAALLARAESLHAALRSPLPVGSATLRLTVSVGVAAVPPADPRQALRDADTALSVAKEGGGDRLVVFAPAHLERARRRAEVEGAMRDDIGSGAFRLVYQPIVRLETGACVGAEALCRWTSARLGEVSPAEFVPLAERTGLIVPLGREVLDRAMAGAVRLWRRGRYVAVNLSVRQLDDRLVEDVSRHLAASGLPGGALHLEVTETALLADLDAARARLGALDALGVRLAIDDFGTGYASFAWLRDLPVHTIKIERTFVAGLGCNGRDEVVVEAVVRTARQLGVGVVAEGVETEAQRARLVELGCPFGQGWLFGRPGPVDRIP